MAAMIDFERRLLNYGSDAFRSLREGQHRVLHEYAENHLATSDLAIEMPTGEGKTLVALLIADHALDEGMSVAYLTGTRQLAEQVQTESDRIGIETALFSAQHYDAHALARYHDAQLIAIMNYWVYFNSSPTPQPADLIILDDAHLAEQPLANLDLLRIDHKSAASTDLYNSICDIITSHTSLYPRIGSMRDGTSEPGAPPELIAFYHWTNVSSAIRDVIQSSPVSSSGDARFVWPRIRHHLDSCCVLVGREAVEIRPYHPLSTTNKWYAEAKQRIYLSATLGSMDDLQRRVGGYPISKLDYVSTRSDEETGERCLILNPTLGNLWESEVFDWVLEQVDEADGIAAWLCSSNSEADEIQRRLEDLGDTVYRLIAGHDSVMLEWIANGAGHLVTAGRYDGLDLADDVCHLVVIPTMPHSSSEFERFIASYVGDASYVNQRIGQRITQALGRANRSSRDYSLYLGLDPRFGQVLANPEVLDSIPVHIRPTVTRALVLHGEGLAAAYLACKQFWSDEADDEEATNARASSRRRPGRQRRQSVPAATATAEIQAITDLWLSRFVQAARAAAQVADDLATVGRFEHAAFWRYVEAHARYLEGGAHATESAVSSLRVATTNAPRTTWFSRLEKIQSELENRRNRAGNLDALFGMWDEWIMELGAERMLRRMSHCRSDLLGTHDQQCQALEMVASLCGAYGMRPKRSEQAAADCIWSWHSQRRGQRRVWEVKTEEAERLSRSHVNQLLGQIEVERKRSPSARVRGSLLTRATSVRREAAEAARDNIAIVHQDALVRLVDLMTDRFRRYANEYGDGDARSRGQARTSVEGILPAHNWLQQFLKPSGGRIRSVAEVEDLFPQDE